MHWENYSTVKIQSAIFYKHSLIDSLNHPQTSMIKYVNHKARGFIFGGQIDSKSAMPQVMAWCLAVDNPPLKMVSRFVDTYFVWSQWVSLIPVVFTKIHKRYDIRTIVITPAKACYQAGDKPDSINNNSPDHWSMDALSGLDESVWCSILAPNTIQNNVQYGNVHRCWCITSQ